LSMAGASAHEEFLALRLALASRRVTNVIWSMDVDLFYSRPDSVRAVDQTPFPYYLYRTLPLPSPEYLLSLSTMRLSYLALHGYGHTDLDTYHSWFDKFKFGEEEALNVWKNYLHGTCDFFAPKFDPAEPC